jgi:hypothetical protein
LSYGSDFNLTYHVSFTLEEIAKGACYIGTYPSLAQAGVGLADVADPVP